MADRDDEMITFEKQDDGGRDPANISGRQEKFAGAQRIEPRIR